MIEFMRNAIGILLWATLGGAVVAAVIYLWLRVQFGRLFGNNNR